MAAEGKWDLGPIINVGIMAGIGAAGSYLFDDITVMQGIEQYVASGIIGSYISDITPFFNKTYGFDELCDAFAGAPYALPLGAGLFSALERLAGGCAYELLSGNDVSMPFVSGIAGIGGLLFGGIASGIGRLRK